MPPIETFHRHEKVVLLTANGSDRSGEPTVGIAEEITVRWEEASQDIIDMAGRGVQIHADLVVDRKIKVGSKVWLGKLTEFPGQDLLTDTDETLYEVVKYTECPDLKHRHIRRIASIGRYRDAEPSTVV